MFDFQFCVVIPAAASHYSGQITADRESPDMAEQGGNLVTESTDDDHKPPVEAEPSEKTEGVESEDPQPSEPQKEDTESPSAADDHVETRVEQPEADVEQAGAEGPSEDTAAGEQKPTLKTGLSDTLQDMGIDSAEGKSN